jgi:hypothetical protein
MNTYELDVANAIVRVWQSEMNRWQWSIECGVLVNSLGNIEHGWERAEVTAKRAARVRYAEIMGIDVRECKALWINTGGR